MLAPGGEVGCASEAVTEASSEEPVIVGGIPRTTNPCDETSRRRFWPNAIASSTLPILVHYPNAADATKAREVLAMVETSWKVETKTVGFRAPPRDAGKCGPDDRFDVFLWHDEVECYVDVLDVPTSISKSGVVPFMVLDAWGKYASTEQFHSTIAHELNHACQSAYTWNAPDPFFEATATAMQEAVVHQPAGYVYTLGFGEHPTKKQRAAIEKRELAKRKCQRDVADDRGFQDFPERALDHDDHYATWASYGSGLYLWYLDSRAFDADFTLLPRLWERVGEGADPLAAIDGELRRRGKSFPTTLSEFAAWRWHVGARASKHQALQPWLDLNHLPEVVQDEEVVTSRGREVTLTAEPSGSRYLVAAPATTSARLVVELVETSSDDVEWVVQALPSTSSDADSDRLDLSRGSATTIDWVSGQRVLVATAVPRRLDSPRKNLRSVTLRLTAR
jgi:hypothetical protein